ncbi:hypothetical protein N7495_006017 [Penicillium taxi]|uniref:uncharacterized protein n=1 Tax=Penicillium taxi TaxID=168475 RepID=UPI0025451560|nr:uncharacterized protein N7495_006017 [Penicillium taxi]KAJ5894326.1 hypothetical protein N7495_006017 [Penicillium taxi]
MSSRPTKMNLSDPNDKHLLKNLHEEKSGSNSTQCRMKEEPMLSPMQLLSEHMDSKGSPVPDPAFKDKPKGMDDDADVFDAMTADFD